MLKSSNFKDESISIGRQPISTCLRMTAVNRGYFAVLSLRRDNFLAVGSVNINDIYLNTQLRTLYIDINIVKIYAGSDM